MTEWANCFVKPRTIVIDWHRVKGVARGLGYVTPDQVAKLLSVQVPVTWRPLAFGETAWEAFRSPTGSGD
ncbi:MAG: hypothetical protein H0T49_04950 [Chloroflexia bacterium]|nr:hypothetical protein [Chloroflexia bacterium]